MGWPLTNLLIQKLLEQAEPQLVPIEEFFDGNDDMGSIGCNLPEHPGVEAFRDALFRIARRSDVQAVYAQIAELDPGEGSWPFTDTIFVAGSLSIDALASELAPLEPDEVGTGEDFGAPDSLTRNHSNPVLAAWWD